MSDNPFENEPLMIIENGIYYWWDAETQLWKPDWNDLRHAGLLDENGEIPDEAYLY